nr:hypothetical protein [Tanacetum cinerariifolium]
GYGINSFGLGFGALTGATTGSATRATTSLEFGIGVSIWTTRGWTSLVLPLLVEASCPLSPRSHVPLLEEEKKR